MKSPVKGKSLTRRSTTTLEEGDQILTLSDPLAHAEREGWTVIQVPSRAETAPQELAGLKDNGGVLLIYEHTAPSYCTAHVARFIFNEIIERTAGGRYSYDELALVLSAQTGRSVSFFEDKIRAGYAKGQLCFWLPDGSPAECPPSRPDDAMGPEDYLGLSGEYTTVEAANDWLERWGAQYRLEPYKATTHGKRQAKQRELILSTLREMGYDPHKLPKPPEGNPGPKAEVKRKLKDHPLFEAVTAFNTAWKELRELDALVYV